MKKTNFTLLFTIAVMLFSILTFAQKGQQVINDTVQTVVLQPDGNGVNAIPDGLKTKKSNPIQKSAALYSKVKNNPNAGKGMYGTIALKPLYEEFTSATCGPCANANEILDPILADNPGEFSLIKYQMNWPGSGDPYYTEEGGVRKDFYGVVGAPDMYINANQQYPGDMTQAIFDSYTTGTTDMSLGVTASIDQDYMITVDVSVNPNADYDAGLTLHMVVVEKITVGNVMGNGETEFNNVMMKMLPDAEGTTLDALTAGVSVDFSESYDMSLTFMEQPNDLAIIVFTQDDITKTVYQSEMIDVEGTFDSYDLTFVVDDSDGNLIEGAEIFVEGNGTLYTGATGEITYEGVFPGSYTYTVQKPGLEDAAGIVEVVDQGITEYVTLNIPDFYIYEDFELELPDTWTTYSSGWNYLYWYDGKVIFFRQDPGDALLMLVSPEIDMDIAGTLSLSIGDASNDPTFAVGTVDDPANFDSFVELASFTALSEYQNFEVELSTYTGDHSYIAIKLSSEENSFFSLDLFTITWGGVPLYPPSNLTAEVDEYNVNLNWEAPDTDALLGYNVYRDGDMITNVTETFYTDMELEPGLYEYYVRAEYDEGQSAPSNVVEVIVGDVLIYCDAEGGCDEFIANVLFGDIDNTSDCTNYGDYTSMSTSIEADSTYPLQVTLTTVYSSDDYGVWIDWNQNGDFSDAGENVVCEIDNGLEVSTWDITVPADAIAGDTRMRIRLKYSGSNCGDPCGTTTYGEVEDYTVNVISGGGTTVAFFDDFEDGISNWEVTGAWAITDEQSYSPGNSLTDSPGGDYLPNQETYATMTTGVDLSDPAILSADVDWWMIMDIENGNFDYLYVEVSTDDFASYTEIASFFGEGMLDPWMQYTYPLGAFLGFDNVKVRFHFSSDGGYEVDGCYIDDFSILTSDVDDAAPEIFFDAPFAYEGSLGDYMLEAEIIDASGVASAEIIYTVDGEVQPNVIGENSAGNTWSFTIPQQDPGYQVDFVISAIDVSTSSNGAISDTASYIAGNYIGYDNAVVDFYTTVDSPGGASVVFTIEAPAQLVTALIRNYTDQSQPPNDDMLVHIWSDGGAGPGEDLIDPILISPEANLVNTRAFTRIDLRPYAAELSELMGNIFVGYTVPGGTCLTTISQPGIGDRSFNSIDGTSWASIGDDYHFRIVTGEGGPNPYPAPENVTATVENINDVLVGWDVPGTGGVTDLIGYNILRDGEEIAYVEVLTTEYDDMDLQPGTYEYCVTAVYDDGESIEVCADPVIIFPNELPPAPTNLETEVDVEDIVLTWDAPGDEWMFWDSGENNGNGIGLNGGGTMVVSSHWDPASLVDYNGLTLTQIHFFPNGDPDATFTIKVWTGPTGMNEVLSQDVTSYNVDEWNIVDLDTPVTIDGTQDLWFGYAVEHEDGMFPAGCDDGPAIAGYGDMILQGSGWESLVGLNPALDYNWNIAGYVEAADGTSKLIGAPVTPSTDGTYAASGSTGVTSKMTTAGSKSLEEYNVYYSYNNGPFSLEATTTETTWTHEGAGIIYAGHCYQVTAVYDPEGESDPTEEACEWLNSVPEFLLNATAVYPNPASDVVNITSDFEIELIRVYNHAGQIVTDQMINSKMYQLNTSEFNSGLYLFQIETTEGTISKRVIIQ